MTTCSLGGRKALLLLSLALLTLQLPSTCDASFPAASSSAALSPSDLCSTTFLQVLAAVTNKLRTAPPFRCPAGCLGLTAGSGAAVYGSYPYHANSSLCLAAIHCGVISEAAGGWLQCGRFGAYRQPVLLDLTSPQPDVSRVLSANGSYRAVVADISGQELFPFNSSLPSLSNGVQTLHAAAGDGCPSCTELRNTSAADASWVVWGRGVLVPAPAIAPWPARAGHLQAALLYSGIWLVVGGRNDSHYLNDVWLGQRTGDELGRGDYVSLDSAGAAQWMRLPDAPFTGRSAMRVQVLTSFIVAYGGQTGHQCGLHELGVCSDEVWRMDWSLNASSPTFGLTLAWSRTGRLPAAVCDAALVVNLAHNYAGQFMPVLLLGGQLSYEDVSCQQPIVSSNAVYYSSDASRQLWQRAADAPFSPRRSAIVELSLYSLYSAGNPGLMMLPLRGGVRYTNHTRDAETGIARLTSAELYADVWGCELATSVLHCSSWVSYNSSGRGSVIASLPFPVVRRGSLSAAVGGRTSAAAVRAWQQTRPWTLDASGASWAELPVNATHIMQPLLGRIDQWTGLTADSCDADLALSRYGLPLSYALDEAELNDPNGAWLAGSDWLVLNTLTRRADVGQTVRTSAHPLPVQLLQRAEDSTAWLQQAASATNTTRALFEVSLRRFDVSELSQDVAGTPLHSPHAFYRSPLSGGQTGAGFSSDWLTFPTACCPPPSDPSYRLLLGNGSIPDGELRLLVEAQCVSHLVTPIVPWRCADGFHIEPPQPQEGREAQLKCLHTQLWVDASSGVLSTCVRDRLSCAFPLVDVGDEACVLPAPRITALSIDIDTLDARCDNPVDEPTALVDCPMVPMLLSITGSWFALPLQVWVGGQPCLFPALHSVNGTKVCVGSSGADDCLEYGGGVTCALRGLQGHQLPVRLFSGPGSQQPVSTQPQPSVSYSAPTIVNVTSALDEVLNRTAMPWLPALPGSCRRRSWTELTHCSQDAAFSLLLVGYNFYITLGEPLPGHGWWPQVTAAPLLVSGCRALLGASLLGPLGYRLHELNLLLCQVTPGPAAPLMTAIPLLMRQDGGLSNLVFNASVLSPSTITLRGCEAGSMDVGVSHRGSAGPHCQLCAAGSSTAGLDGQTACQLCAIGTAAGSEGSVRCSDCPVNSFANRTGLASCFPCPPNSYQLATRAADCHVCDLSQYLRWTADGPQCQSCLPSHVAHCFVNGSVEAASPGVYLVLDQSSGLVSAAPCSASRCLAASDCLSAGGGGSVAASERTGVSIVNCCSANRAPPADNPLCGRCLDGYQEWNGECLPCQWQHVNAPLLLLTGLLGLLLVWALHRLPDDSNSATLSIFLYFVQTSLLFFSSEQLPQMLALFNLNLLGDWPRAVRTGMAACLLPLSPMEKIALSTAMPAIALVYLLPLLTLQLAAAHCLRRRGRAVESSRLYLLVFGGDVDDGTLDKQQSSTSADLTQPPTAQLASSPRSKDEEDKQVGSGSAAEAELRLPSAAAASSSQSRFIRRSYSCTLIRLLLYGYTSTAELTLSYLHCQPVGAYGSFLQDWPAVSCSSPQYRALLPVVIALLLLLVVIPPAALTALLWLQRERIARRMTAAHSASASASGAAGSYLAVQDGGADSLLARVSDKLELLYAVYRPGCSWYAVVGLLRRLLLVAVFVFAPPASAFLWLAMACGCLLMLHCMLWPYRRRVDNAGEWLTLLALFLQCGCIAQTPLPWSGTEATAARLSSVLLLVVLPAALVVASPLAGRLRRAAGIGGKQSSPYTERLMYDQLDDALD